MGCARGLASERAGRGAANDESSFPNGPNCVSIWNPRLSAVSNERMIGSEKANGTSMGSWEEEAKDAMDASPRMV